MPGTGPVSGVVLKANVVALAGAAAFRFTVTRHGRGQSGSSLPSQAVAILPRNISAARMMRLHVAGGAPVTTKFFDAVFGAVTSTAGRRSSGQAAAVGGRGASATGARAAGCS